MADDQYVGEPVAPRNPWRNLNTFDRLTAMYESMPIADAMAMLSVSGPAEPPPSATPHPAPPQPARPARPRASLAESRRQGLRAPIPSDDGVTEDETAAAGTAPPQADGNRLDPRDLAPRIPKPAAVRAPLWPAPIGATRPGREPAPTDEDARSGPNPVRSDALDESPDRAPGPDLPGADDHDTLRALESPDAPESPDGSDGPGTPRGGYGTPAADSGATRGEVRTGRGAGPRADAGQALDTDPPAAASVPSPVVPVVRRAEPARPADTPLPQRAPATGISHRLPAAAPRPADASGHHHPADRAALSSPQMPVIPAPSSPATPDHVGAAPGATASPFSSPGTSATQPEVPSPDTGPAEPVRRDRSTEKPVPPRPGPRPDRLRPSVSGPLALSAPNDEPSGRSSAVPVRLLGPVPAQEPTPARSPGLTQYRVAGPAVGSSAPAPPHPAALDQAPAGQVTVPTDVADLVEARLGLDVRGVPIHRGPAVDAPVAGLRARAFTRDGQVFLPAAAGSLDSRATRALLVHELVHVGQQRALGPALPAEGTAAGRSLEAAAVTAEHWALEGASGPVAGSGLRHHRGAPPLPHPAADPAPAPRPPEPDTVPAGSLSPPSVSWTADGGFGPDASGSAPVAPDAQPGSELPATTASAASPLPQRAEATVTPSPPPAAVAADLAGRLDRLTAQVADLLERIAPPEVDLFDVRHLDSLAGRLYRHIRSRLRAELLVDRERAGLLADLQMRSTR